MKADLLSRHVAYALSLRGDAMVTGDAYKELAELATNQAAALRQMHAAVPGGSVCDPQQIADTLRSIAASVGVDVDQ